MAHYLAMYLNGGTYQGERIRSAEGVDTMLEQATNEFTAQYGLGYGTPLLWELGLSLLVLFGCPALTGIGWRGNFVSIPDLTIVLLTVAALWLVTGIVRAVRLVSARGLLERKHLTASRTSRAASEARPQTVNQFAPPDGTRSAR